jgi:N-acetylmuramoyl-L-alanine amidase
LALTTALILRDSLKALGAEVFLTREKGNYSAMGMHFDEWVQTELVDTLLRKGYSLKQIDKKIGASSRKKLYKEHFLDMDLDARAARINYFNPHFTVVIHFNADVENTGWFQPTVRNYSMAFVPGSYIGGELSNSTERFDFIRTLLTDHMQQSALLSKFVMDEFENHLGVMSVSKYGKKPFYLTNYSIEVEKGVYARNLRLCRLLNTPLCYGESLLQDNIHELEALSKNDLKNGIIAPRIIQVAEAYLYGIKRYAEVLKQQQQGKGFLNRP